MPNRLVALAVTVAVALGACAVTQPQPPKTDLPSPTATAAQSALLERWWVAFDDPVLTQLVDEALAQNLDLRASLARVEAARSQLLLAQSNLAPSIDLRVDPSRSRISGVGSQPLPPGTPLISNDFRVAIEMSYELDVWGKYRAGVLAAQNDVVAARYYREAVRISVAAEVANAYFRLRAADAELKLLDDTLRLRTETLDLQRDRFEGGLIGEYELRTSEAERSAVVADIARARNAIEQLSSAVAVLTGRSPRMVFDPEIARGATIDAVTAVPTLPEGLPAGLLERRPDIRRSEALLASSDLKIQQARANYYPSLTLGLSYGSQAAATGNLFSGPAAIWSLGLGLVQPLLALRAIDAQVALARAGNDLAAVAGAGFGALLVLWVVAGVANTVGTIAYESMLQQHTPDALRGRVIAGSEAVMNIATLGGLGLVGLIGEAVGARAIFLVSGVLFVGAGLVSARMVREGAEIAPAKTPA